MASNKEVKEIEKEIFDTFKIKMPQNPKFKISGKTKINPTTYVNGYTILLSPEDVMKDPTPQFKKAFEYWKSAKEEALVNLSAGSIREKEERLVYDINHSDGIPVDPKYMQIKFTGPVREDWLLYIQKEGIVPDVLSRIESSKVIVHDSNYNKVINQLKA